MSTKLVKELVRNPYAWPGGYERAAITNDGALLCVDCVKANFREIIDSIVHNIDDGWKVVATCYEAVPADCCDDDYKSYCDHCGKEFGEFC